MHTCWVVVLQLWDNEALLQVARLQGIDKHLIGPLRHSMIGHLEARENGA